MNKRFPRLNNYPHMATLKELQEYTPKLIDWASDAEDTIAEANKILERIPLSPTSSFWLGILEELKQCLSQEERGTQ